MYVETECNRKCYRVASIVYIVVTCSVVQWYCCCRDFTLLSSVRLFLETFRV